MAQFINRFLNLTYSMTSFTRHFNTVPLMLIQEILFTHCQFIQYNIVYLIIKNKITPLALSCLTSPFINIIFKVYNGNLILPRITKNRYTFTIFTYNLIFFIFNLKYYLLTFHTFCFVSYRAIICSAIIIIQQIFHISFPRLTYRSYILSIVSDKSIAFTTTCFDILSSAIKFSKWPSTTL